MSKLILGAVYFLIIISLFRQVYLLVSHQQIPGDDFRCYYTTAWMVRTHQSADVYLASGNTDPTFDLGRVKPETAFARTAAAHHVHFNEEVLPYTYPLTLADLMVPLTFLSPGAAFLVFTVLSVAALVWGTVILVRIPGIGIPGQLLPVLGFLLFRPTIDAFVWGQVTVFLFLMIIAGISLYLNGNRNSAALLFALAIAIKLTPLILVVPLLAWRDWKMLRAVAMWGVVLAAGLLMVNHWAWVHVYFRHEMPSIGTKFDIGSRSLITAFQVAVAHTQRGVSVPFLTLLAKIVSVGLIGYAAWQSRRRGTFEVSNHLKFESFAWFLLLSSCLSPVAWSHGYLLGAPAFLICIDRIRRSEAKASESILFFLLICSLSTATLMLFVFLSPLLAVALAMIGLHRLPQSQAQTQLRNNPIHVSS